jgi:hypothetical protein
MSAKAKARKGAIPLCMKISRQMGKKGSKFALIWSNILTLKINQYLN